MNWKILFAAALMTGISDAVEDRFFQEDGNDPKLERGAGLRRLESIRTRLSRVVGGNSGTQRAETQKAEYKEIQSEAVQGRVSDSYALASDPQYADLAEKPAREYRQPAQQQESSPGQTINSDAVFLLRNCQSLGPHISKNDDSGKKARDLYAKKCAPVLSEMILKERLDVFWPIHARWLIQEGRHQEAYPYLSEYYQNFPNEFESNLLLTRNLADLGESVAAMEMLEFFLQRVNPKELSPSQHREIEEVQTYLSSMSMSR